MSTSREQLSTDDLHSKCRRRRPLRILENCQYFQFAAAAFHLGGKPPEGGKRTFLVKVTGKFGE